MALVVLAGWSATLQAQIGPNTGMLVTSISYTYAKSENFDESLKGAAFSLVWEQVTWDRQMSIGFGGAYSSSWFERSVNQYSFTRIPFYAIFKGLFGPPNYQGYLGVGLGASIDRLEVTGENGIERRETKAPFSFIIPLGIYIVPNPKVGFNFSASYTWSNTDFLESGSFWAGTFGLVFLLD
jgi:hypothetical protein